MTHPRQTIREAVVEILKDAAILDVGDRVYANRILALDVVDLPAIAVTTLPEAATVDDFGTKTLKRDMTLSVELLLKDPDEELIDDLADDYAEAIEAAMKADETLKNTATDSYLTTTEMTTDVKGEVPLLQLKLNYAVRYFY